MKLRLNRRRGFNGADAPLEARAPNMFAGERFLKTFAGSRFLEIPKRLAVSSNLSQAAWQAVDPQALLYPKREKVACARGPASTRISRLLTKEQSGSNAPVSEFSSTFETPTLSFGVAAYFDHHETEEPFIFRILEHDDSKEPLGFCISVTTTLRRLSFSAFRAPLLKRRSIFASGPSDWYDADAQLKVRASSIVFAMRASCEQDLHMSSDSMKQCFYEKNVLFENIY
jgi:hypothetical protein